MSVRKSLAWSYGAQAFIFVFTFGSSIVVARLLGPYEMGIFAVGISMAGALSILSSFGVGPYLIRQESLEGDVKATVFTVNALLNLTVASVMVAVVVLGPLFGLNAEVRRVMLLLAIGPVIGIFDFLPSTMLQREMNFKVISMISMARAVVNSVLLVGFASSGLGSLSPALAIVGSSLISTITYNVVAPRHISVRLALTGWRELTRFGLQMMSIGGLAMLIQRLSELILARFLGVAALGVYTRASSLANQVWDNVYGLSTRVIFSQMATEMREQGTLRVTFIKGIAIITALVWPLLIGLSVLSGPIVLLLYGPKWSGAAVPLSILLVTMFVSLGFGMNWELCVLRGRTGWQARNEFIRAIVGLVAFTIGATFSLAGAALGRVCESVSGLFLFGPKMREMAGTEPGEIAHVYRESGLLTVVAVMPAAIVMTLNDWSVTSPWWQLGPAIACGIGCWLVTLRLIRHPLLAELSHLLGVAQRRWHAKGA